MNSVIQLIFEGISDIHCVKRVQIRSFLWSVFSPNAGKYGPEKTPYFNTFHAVISISIRNNNENNIQINIQNFLKVYDHMFKILY